MSALRKLLAIVVIISLIVIAVAVIERFNDTGMLGGRASRLQGFGIITIEYDYMGSAPNPAYLDDFDAFVERYTGKLVTISLTAVSSIVDADGSITPQEAIDRARAERDTYSFIGISIHILHLNTGISGAQSGYHTAGFAYDATSIIISNTANPYLDIVLAHEMGHLMGLCGISMPDPKNVCDGNGHARNPDSLMAAVLNPNSAWVQNVELMPEEVALLTSL